MACSRMRSRRNNRLKAKRLGSANRRPDLDAALDHWMPIMLWMSRAAATGEEVVPVLIENASSLALKFLGGIPANSLPEMSGDMLFTVLGVPRGVLVTVLLGTGHPDLARLVSVPPPRDHRWSVVVASNAVKVEPMPLISPHLSDYDAMMKKSHDSLMRNVRVFRSQGLPETGWGLIMLDYHDHFGRYVSAKYGIKLPSPRGQGSQWPFAVAPVQIGDFACPSGSVLVQLITGGYVIPYVLSDTGVERVVEESQEAPVS
jgi:hypothetical protein